VAVDNDQDTGVPLTGDGGTPVLPGGPSPEDFPAVAKANPPAAPPPDEGALRAFVVGGAYGLLALLGLAMGCIGSLHYRWSAGPVPVAAIVLVALNFAVPWLVGWGMRAKSAAAVPWVTWMAVVIAASSPRAEGDLLITGDLPGYLFMIGGMVTGGLAVALTRSAGVPGAWLLGPGVTRDRT